MRAYMVFGFLFGTVLIYPTVAEVFSSVTMLRRTVVEMKKLKINDYITSYIQTRKGNLKRLKKLLGDIKEVNKLLADPYFRVEHPVYAFKFIRLQSSIVGRVEEELKKKRTSSTEWTDFEEYFQILPKQSDLEGAAKGLVRLQDIYHLDTTAMANGQIDKFTSIPMSAAECLHFAVIVKDLSIRQINMKNIAVRWLEEAWRKVENENDTTVDVLSIARVLMDVYVNVSCECSSEARELNKTLSDLAQQDRSFLISNAKCLNIKEFRCQKVRVKTKKTVLANRFHALCRQEHIQLTPEMQEIRTPTHILKCRYVHYNDPNLILQPLHIEELNTIRPYIAILHDVIREREIKYIKKVAKPRLKRGTVLKMQGQTVSEFKISQTTVLPRNYTMNKLRNFHSRLAAFTGLNIRGFEPLQVANYGTGGYYDLHVDLKNNKTTTNFSLITDNRLLTVVMYLTDVEAGGQTCFPKVGVIATPKKGNALLFYNLNRNGSGLGESMHTSCPVMVGDKTIANQWVTRYHQEFHYRCSTDPAD